MLVLSTVASTGTLRCPLPTVAARHGRLLLPASCLLPTLVRMPHELPASMYDRCAEVRVAGDAVGTGSHRHEVLGRTHLGSLPLRQGKFHTARQVGIPGAPPRTSFAKIREPLEVPNLLALQTESFDWLVGNDAWQRASASRR